MESLKLSTTSLLIHYSEEYAEKYNVSPLTAFKTHLHYIYYYLRGFWKRANKPPTFTEEFFIKDSCRVIFNDTININENFATLVKSYYITDENYTFNEDFYQAVKSELEQEQASAT